MRRAKWCAHYCLLCCVCLFVGCGTAVVSVHVQLLPVFLSFLWYCLDLFSHCWLCDCFFFMVWDVEEIANLLLYTLSRVLV